jgi:hypothetical protein
MRYGATQPYRKGIAGHTGAGACGYDLDVTCGPMPKVVALADPAPAGRATAAAPGGAAAGAAGVQTHVRESK